MVYRQGDVLLVEVKGRVKGKVVAKGRIVLAEGEATGHAHVVEADPEDAVLKEFDGKRFLEVYREASVTHQEHATITLKPKTYEVRRQREWTDGDEPRQVLD